MSIPMNNILRAATRTEQQPLNILWLPYDGVFESTLLPHLRHNFYIGLDSSPFPLETKWLKSNNIVCLPRYNSFALGINFDAIVCNYSATQHEKAINLSHSLHIPLITINHTTPQSSIGKYNTHMRVSTHHEVNKSWGVTDQIIGYNISECFPNEDRENKIIIVGKFLEPDYNQIRQLQNISPIPIEIIGDNKGLSDYMEWSSVLEKMSNAKYYLNISKIDALPILMLQAMKAGCYIITNKSPFTKGLFTDKTGKYFGNINNLDDIFNNLNTATPSNISHTHNPINEGCVSQWGDYLDNIYNITYIRK